MVITLDIPDDGRKFRAFKGRELIAWIEPSEPDVLVVKETSCNLCGECCMDRPSTIYGADDEGRCKMLQKWGDTWECGAGVAVPFSCLDDPTGVECCSIKHRRVKLV